ncbi:putative acetyltransferase [Chitinophaga eiseniae]|uniref:Putative acetyltransferase n=1 Tax=Chitinophaga eiseniae TaxID=634771 RepID=A0A1T4P253_9BACT|nr:acetyltransferase [Chitinophaga eiseniae]SJZ85482.1 putative acetyltransferase [Chitinophaga eiseniae]
MKIRRATANDYPEMVRIWESAVKATHDFLTQEDFEHIKGLLAEAFFPQVDTYLLLNDEGRSLAFLGVHADSLEMLFVDDASREKGVGKQLMHYALTALGIRKVDVNEQNSQAVGFYEQMGFKVSGRSEKDGMGKPYPILHMER